MEKGRGEVGGRKGGWRKGKRGGAKGKGVKGRGRRKGGRLGGKGSEREPGEGGFEGRRAKVEGAEGREAGKRLFVGCFFSEGEMEREGKGEDGGGERWGAVGGEQTGEKTIYWLAYSEANLEGRRKREGIK